MCFSGLSYIVCFVLFLGCCAEKHEDSGTVKPSGELSQEDIGVIKMRISKLFEPVEKASHLGS